MIPPLPHIKAMSPYALASLSPPAGKTLISLSQNECLRPPSPAATKAAKQAMTQAHLYPDPDWCALRQALSAHHNIPTSGILCGNGSLDLIACLTQAYANPQNAVLAPGHAYPFFRTAAQMAQARFDVAEEDNTTASVDTLLGAVRPDTRIAFIANPGNPTGTRLTKSDILRLREGLRQDILLVIDEAYGEFTDHINAPTFDMVAQGNTIVLRTFSKAYGLAGMRVGWGLFPPEIATQIRKVMNPNNISVAGQAAALAALKDQDYMRQTCTDTAIARTEFTQHLRDQGFVLADSFTNFVLIEFVSAQAASSANAALQANGIFVRPQAGAGLPHCLRVTIGDTAALTETASLLNHWQKERTT